MLHCNPMVVYLATGKFFEIPPPRQECFTMLGRCHGTASIYFTKVMRCVIKNVFGWARHQYGPSFNDVLLWTVDAYSMTVENDTS